MVKPGRFFKKARGHRPAITLHELTVLLAQEVAGVYDDQIQERSLAFEIPDGFERCDAAALEFQPMRAATGKW